MTTRVRYVPVTAERPTEVKATIGVLVFLGVTALGGGIEMLLYPNGNEFLPGELMDRVPLLDSFVLPGVVLATVFGIGSLFAAWGLIRRPEVKLLQKLEDGTDRHWSWAGTAIIGLAFASWMIVEIAVLGTPWDTESTSEAITTWVLYGIYLTVAVSLLVLPQTHKVRTYLTIGPQARNQAASS